MANKPFPSVSTQTLSFTSIHLLQHQLRFSGVYDISHRSIIEAGKCYQLILFNSLSLTYKYTTPLDCSVEIWHIAHGTEPASIVDATDMPDDVNPNQNQKFLFHEYTFYTIIAHKKCLLASMYSKRPINALWVRINREPSQLNFQDNSSQIHHSLLNVCNLYGADVVDPQQSKSSSPRPGSHQSRRWVFKQLL